MAEVNPVNTSVAKTTLREVREAAHAVGVQIEIVNATTILRASAPMLGLTFTRDFQLIADEVIE